MAGRSNNRLVLAGLGNSPRTAVSSRSSRFLLSKSTAAMEHLLGVGSTPSGIMKPGDKTVCQYCGVSYLTMSELRSLQTTVKDQETKLGHFKTISQENARLKDSVANIRKQQMGELMKQEESNQRLTSNNETLQTQLEIMKRELKDTKQKYTDLQLKYSISSEDSRLQEDVISQLRDEIQGRDDLTANNSALKEKVKNLESALHKVLVQLTSNGLQSEKSFQMIHQLEMGDGSSGRNRNFQDVIAKPDPSEWGNIRLQKQRSFNTYNQENGKPKVSSLASIETHDLKRQIGLLSEKLRSLTEEHSNCSDLHAFLRDTIEKLKMDNMKLHESTSCLKVEYEERIMESSNLEAKLEGVQSENNRTKEFAKQLESQFKVLAEQNKAIKKSHDPKLVEHLQKTVLHLQHQFEQQKVEIEELNQEFENKLSEAGRESAMEKERADSCLASSLSERENVEKRWEERWDRHQSALNQELDSLKANHEDTLRKTREHENTLQKDLNSLNEKFEKSKEAWESYRKTLQDQINQWKIKYEKKHQDLESTRKTKVEVEVMFQEKTKELVSLHEIVRDGCEERQELQTKVQQLEESLEEVKSNGTSLKRFYTNPPPPTAYGRVILNHLHEKSVSAIGAGGVMRNGLMSCLANPLKCSISECILPSTSSFVPPGEISSFSSIGLIGHPPGSSIRPSDITSVNSSATSTAILFTVGKGKKISSNGGGKEKNLPQKISVEVKTQKGGKVTSSSQSKAK